MKMLRQIAVVLLLCGSVMAGEGRDFSSLYDRATLEKWQASFRDDITLMFQGDILPALTPEEKSVLAGVKLDFPQVGNGRGVFDFYAGDRTITLSIVSLRFFADLALAYSWLNANGYNTETVQQYVGMIHYQPRTAFVGGAYPRPLDALGIPANVRDDPRVMKNFSELFSTTVFFLIGHELGHLRHGHRGYAGVSGLDARKHEAEADAFAVELMRRKRVVPAGPLFWFSSAAVIEPHRIDFASEQAWERYFLGQTHPLSAARIDALTKQFEAAAPDFAKSQPDPQRGLQQMLKLITNFRTVSTMLSDEGVHRLFRRQSETSEPRMLAPRRTVAYQAPAVAPARHQPFDGTYDCVVARGNAAVDVRVTFRRTGNDAIGDYTYGTTAGKFRGVVEGDKFTGTWTEGAVTGHASFTAALDGYAFSGNFWVKSPETILGRWIGTRKP